MIFKKEPAARQHAGDEISGALVQELLAADPAYQIGRRLLDELAAQGMEESAALELLLSGSGGRTAIAVRAANGLLQLKAAGKLSAEPESYLGDERFVSLLVEMPVSAAVKLYELARATEDAETRFRAEGEQAAMERMMARRALPASIRGSAPASAQRDYTAMSSAEFAALREQFSRAAREGRRVSL